MEVSISVENTILDLKSRWLRAREYSISKVIATANSEISFFFEINLISEEVFEDLLKVIFLNSRNLGLSYQKAKNLSWERIEFINYAKSLGSPCLNGEWEQRSTASVLTRKGCKEGIQLGHRYCQYWREAIDGLVIGLSEDIGFVRNNTVTIEDDLCVDIFYDDESIPTDAIWNNSNKWGQLPPAIQSDLATIEQKFNEMKVDLKFLGLSEKTLYYKLEPKENLTCGTAGNIYRNHLEGLIKEKFPLIKLKDASPVAVYGESS